MLWNGFEMDEFLFEGYPASVVKPRTREKYAHALLKTEYRDAFPNAEIKLVEDGFFLLFLKNKNRWGTREDLDRKARFVRFCAEKYGFSRRVVPVGMSCGGIFAIKFAVLYPELVSCLYIDAPVIDYMSCPCGFGLGNNLSGRDGDHSEILNALDLNGISGLLSYRDAPIDHLEALARTRIPVLLIAGDSDLTVPFTENGKLLQDLYEKKGLEIKTILKAGCDHHPHGLNDPKEIEEFILTHI